VAAGGDFVLQLECMQWNYDNLFEMNAAISSIQHVSEERMSADQNLIKDASAKSVCWCLSSHV